ncbi:microsomal glutathione S-transferase 1 isoform X2 [Rana temporaria]|nr:microsomal glutathione S-transferase 1 isoform X2 [Rana temporaria]XP_040201433.1 microsomal glutathione S-transferase 1 isoform X2 [Rana temporaria]
MSAIEQFADSEVFRAYATYVAVVLLKMMLMSLCTAYYRITLGVFANPEDALGHAKGGDVKKFVRRDESVERVRRCHLNDIENIVPFVGLGLLYVLSNPELSTALLHFRIFAGSRIAHTISYLAPLPQPGRALSFFAGFFVNCSMGYAILSSISYF